jgi:hypothetical protein
MNRLTLVLAATTAFFGATAIHAYRPWQSQARGAAEETVHAVAEHADLIPGVEMPGPGSLAPAAPSTTDADPGWQALLRYRLALLRDPATRAQRIREYIARLRFGGWEIEGPQIGMSATEVEEYLNARAELIAQRQERLLTCQLDPRCDQQALSATQREEARQDDFLLLGPDLHERMLDNRNLVPHLALARFFDSRLGEAHRMDPATMERLARAFHQEQQRIEQQAKQQGLYLRSATTGELVLLATAGSPDDHQRLADSTREHGQRLLDRAERILTSAQFAAFSRTFTPEVDELVAMHLDAREMQARRRALEARDRP